LFPQFFISLRLSGYAMRPSAIPETGTVVRAISNLQFRDRGDSAISSNAKTGRTSSSRPQASKSSTNAAFARAALTSRSQPAVAVSPEGASMADAREVMNIRQASQYLGISPDTLYKYVSEEIIPAFKLGNRWKFKKSILDRWMENQSLGSPSTRLGKPFRAIAGVD
jgi:excisionase family DNA binding protein